MVKKADVRECVMKNELGNSIIPTDNHLLVIPYDDDPYLNEDNGGIVLTDNSTFVNPDSGKEDKQEKYMAIGKVVAVGDLCKTVEVGDDIYYPSRVQLPIPFKWLGMYVIQENHVYCVIKKENNE